MSNTDLENSKDVIAIELSKKRNNKVYYRIKPLNCPINKKYCCEKITTGDRTSEKKCRFLSTSRFCDDTGYLAVICSCIKKSVSFILDEEDNDFA